MAISLSNESKSKVSLSKEGKNADMTWDGSDPTTWDEMDSQWAAPRLKLVEETKSKISLSKESR